MSAVNSTTFSNKKPTATGSTNETTVTAFGGAVGRDAEFPPGGSCPTGEEVVVTRAVTITQPNNVVIISGRWFFSSDGTGRAQTFRARLDNVSGAILGSTVVATGGVSPSQTNAAEVTLRINTSNVSTSTSNIVLTREHTGASGCTSPRQSTYSFDVWVVDLESSVTAKNANIIRG